MGTLHVVTTTPWTPPEWTVGDRIRRARAEKGWEQRDLAAATGLNKNTISNAEKNAFPVREATLRLLADALGVPVDWLRDGTTP